MRQQRVDQKDLKGRYYPLKEYLARRHGTGAYKVTIDAGFTCPNKDGTLGADGGAGGCAYCAPETLYPNSYDIDTPSIREQLDKGISILEKRRRVEKFIAYFQLNTNTHAPTEELRAIYAEAVSDERISGWAVSTRPDCVPDETLDLFNELSKRGSNAEPLDFWLELGLQSAKDATLARIDRGHSSKAFSDAVLRAAGKGIKVCAHIILGLPGEDKEDILATIRFISELPVWGVKFHQLQVIKGTRLADEYLKGSFSLLSLDEYAELVVECLERLPGDIVIHRLVGDAPQGTQIDPWGPKKFAVLERIHERLIGKDTRQGFLIEKINRLA